MLLSLVVHTYSLRYWFPATIMLGTAPAYLLSWGAWRLLSSVLPARVYHKLDDRLYCMYQSMVLFFFENYTGVEVSGAWEKLTVNLLVKDKNWGWSEWPPCVKLCLPKMGNFTH